VALDKKNIQSFRRRINSGSKACRPCTHNDQIAKLTSLHVIVQPEAIRQFKSGRITKNSLTVANYDRDFFDGYGEPIQQSLRRGVSVKIDISIGMAIFRPRNSRRCIVFAE
jgi:hypothetical protein